MSATTLTYKDTRNYVPVDVIKGIDLKTKETVMADDEAPTGSEIMPKCKNCKNFMPGDEEQLGTCGASAEKFFAYPEMVAVTCGSYEEERE